MRIIRLTIKNFRGIREATIAFGPKTLLLGENQIGKTTLLEALDLVLGPNRVRGPDAISEHDFHLSAYGPPDSAGESSESTAHEPTEIHLEVVLGDLSESLLSQFRRHAEVWDYSCEKVRDADSLADHTPALDEYVLRVGFRGCYSPDDDEFAAQSYFLSPPSDDGEQVSVSRLQKQKIGFLYLRALRTARRAATLQRGSLLDILLELREARPRVWENVLAKLHNLGAALTDDESFQAVLTDLENRLARFLPQLESAPLHGRLYVSRLTREHLREIMELFLDSGFAGHRLPYHLLGTGTANILVLALLSAIAEEKENVIFAMEEPEIALPPHTQRRIVGELSVLAHQVIVTSHSPYVAEQFLGDDILLLLGSPDGVLIAKNIQETSTLPLKTLRKDFRQRYAEGILARATLVVEGITEYLAIPEASKILAGVPDTKYLDLDLSGVVVVGGQGHTDLDKVSSFFRDLGIETYCLVDNSKQADTEKLRASCSELFMTTYSGFERLLAAETPLPAILRFLPMASARSDYPNSISLPGDDAEEEEVREWLYNVLKARKGEGYAALLVEELRVQELPRTLVRTLLQIFCEVSEVRLPANDPLAQSIRAVAPEWFETPREEDGTGDQDDDF